MEELRSGVNVLLVRIGGAGLIHVARMFPEFGVYCGAPRGEELLNIVKGNVEGDIADAPLCDECLRLWKNSRTE
jgi:hypothetical protein